MSARSYLVLATTLVVAVSTPAQKVRDAIIQSDGSTIRGIEVTEMTAAFVVYKRGGTEDKVSAHTVLAIQ